MEDTERARLLGGPIVITVALQLRLRRQHGGALALHLLGLGLVVFRIDVRVLEEREAAFFRPGVSIR